MIEEGIDATVRVGVGNDSRLIMKPLANFRLITCAAPSYLQQMGIPRTPQELPNYRCLNFIYPQTRKEFEWKFKQDGQEIALSVPSCLQFDYVEAILAAGINNGGIIQAPQYIVAEAIAAQKLQAILTDYESQLKTVIAVVYPQKRYLSAKVKVFIEFMTTLMVELKNLEIVS